MFLCKHFYFVRVCVCVCMCVSVYVCEFIVCVSGEGGMERNM